MTGRVVGTTESDAGSRSGKRLSAVGEALLSFCFVGMARSERWYGGTEGKFARHSQLIHEHQQDRV